MYTNIQILEININEVNELNEKQIITRTQKHSIINIQIFMQKDNYLYFLTAVNHVIMGQKNLKIEI